LKDFTSDLINSVSNDNKSRNGFFEHISELAEGTKKGYKTALQNYEIFLQDEYGQDIEQTIESLRNFHGDWQKDPRNRTMFTGNLKQTTYEQLIIQHLQDFANYIKVERKCPICEGNDSKQCRPCRRTGVIVGKGGNQVRSAVTKIKGYLRYFGLLSGVTERNIEKEIKYPKVIEEEPMPLEKSMIQELVKECIDPKRRTFYQVLPYTGLRIIEGCALRKANFTYLDEDGNTTTRRNFKRIQILTDPKYTKFGIQRRTFVSEEIQNEVIELLEKAKDDEPIFVSSKNPEQAEISEERAFDLTRTRLAKRLPVFAEKYESGTHKITLHSFRSYFITKANKVDYGFGHALAGHKQYMARYNRLTIKEKLDLYIQCEKDLSIFNDIDNKTKKLLEHKQRQIDELQTKTQHQDVKQLELLMQIEQANNKIRDLQSRMSANEKAIQPPSRV